MKNRKRDKLLQIRMTENEQKKFDAEYAKTRYNSRADFVMALIDDKPIVVVESLAPIILELRRQGNNINQMAHRINAVNGVDVQPMSMLISRWIEAYDKLLNFEKEVRANAFIKRDKQ